MTSPTPIRGLFDPQFLQVEGPKALQDDEDKGLGIDFLGEFKAWTVAVLEDQLRSEDCHSDAMIDELVYDFQDIIRNLINGISLLVEKKELCTVVSLDGEYLNVLYPKDPEMVQKPEWFQDLLTLLTEYIYMHHLPGRMIIQCTIKGIRASRAKCVCGKDWAQCGNSCVYMTKGFRPEPVGYKKEDL